MSTFVVPLSARSGGGDPAAIVDALRVFLSSDPEYLQTLAKAPYRSPAGRFIRQLQQHGVIVQCGPRR